MSCDAIEADEAGVEADVDTEADAEADADVRSNLLRKNITTVLLPVTRKVAVSEPTIKTCITTSEYYCTDKSPKIELREK